MKVKNIKSFIEFYKSLGITDSIGKYPRIEIKKKFKQSLQESFNSDEDSSNNSADLEKELLSLRNKIKNADCNLKDIATNLVFSDGNAKSDIMFIGEAPGAEEDKLGKPFVGQAGKLLDKMLQFIGLARESNFYITNIVFWRPPGNRTPNSKEIKICLPYTRKHISIIKENYINTTTYPLTYISNSKFRVDQIGGWRLRIVGQR